MGLYDDIRNINIYPNPASGEFMINLDQKDVKMSEIGIFDLSGKKLKLDIYQQ